MEKNMTSYMCYYCNQFLFHTKLVLLYSKNKLKKKKLMY